MLDPVVVAQKVWLKKVVTRDSSKDSWSGFYKRFTLVILEKVHI